MNFLTYDRNKRFGCEFEVLFPEKFEGDVEKFCENLGFNFSFDASLRPMKGYVGREVKTPPMEFIEENFILIARFLNYINSIEGRVNHSCGGHIHIEKPQNISDGYLQTLVFNFKALEPFLFKNQSALREKSTFCKKNKWLYPFENNDDRYRALNFPTGKPTFEFRLFDASLDYDIWRFNIHTAMMIVWYTYFNIPLPKTLNKFPYYVNKNKTVAFYHKKTRKIEIGSNRPELLPSEEEYVITDKVDIVKAWSKTRFTGTEKLVKMERDFKLAKVLEKIENCNLYKVIEELCEYNVIKIYNFTCFCSSSWLAGRLFKKLSSYEFDVDDSGFLISKIADRIEQEKPDYPDLKGKIESAIRNGNFGDFFHRYRDHDAFIRYYNSDIWSLARDFAYYSGNREYEDLMYYDEGFFKEIVKEILYPYYISAVAKKKAKLKFCKERFTYDMFLRSLSDYREQYWCGSISSGEYRAYAYYGYTSNKFKFITYLADNDRDYFEKTTKKYLKRLDRFF